MAGHPDDEHATKALQHLGHARDFALADKAEEKERRGHRD